MKRLIPCLLFVSTWVAAKPAEPETVKLVAACNELVSMYDAQGQEGLLAGWVTSVSEAMQAGYCRGVVVEYRRNKALRQASLRPFAEPCDADDWLAQARVIAGYSEASARTVDIDRLLEASCGR